MEDIDGAEEETLSLFDYSINTSAAKSEWDSEDYSASMIEHEEHYFEFCSEEWSLNTMANAPENIIFCGKIIPYQEPTSGNAQKSQSIKGKGKKRPGLFQWRSKGKSSANTKKEERKSLAMSESRKFSVHKISILASPGKFRWYLLFGITRFPMEMALRDMKNRQSRRIPLTPLFRLEGGETKKVSSSTSTESKNRRQGLWGLLTASGSGGHHLSNTVVKASTGCIP